MAYGAASVARTTAYAVCFVCMGVAACSRAPASSVEHARPSGADSAVTVTELTRAAQQLLDAVATGDTSVWARRLSDAGLFTDENGTTSTKKELLANLRPLPPGLSGRIAVVDPKLLATGREEGSVAILTYDALEDEKVFGQSLHTRYHTTDTYLRRGGEWVLLASQTQVIPSEHVAVAIDPQSLDSYAGSYQLAPEVEYTVKRSGERLLGQRKGRPEEELFPLGGDRFFRRGAPRGEKLFTRDASGRVTAMIDRRDNNDLVWRRVR